MANSYFTIPDTGTIVYNGDTVILAEYPGVMVVAAYGWYKHNQKSEMGWHFILLPTNEAVPAGDVNLSLLTVVSTPSCRPVPPCPPGPIPPGPCPPAPLRMEDRTFITLDSIAQLKRLDTMFMPDGRIVRVNNKGDGEPGYYEWSVATQEWIDWDIAEISPGPSGSADIKYKGVVNSVDSEEYTNKYTKFVFKAGSPLHEHLGVLENTLCELYYAEPYQVIKITETQDLFIRTVIQVEPSWESSEWIASRDRFRLDVAEIDIADIKATLTAIESKVDTWVQNDKLENVLTGSPRLSDEELNELLEARLNGDEVDI